MGWVMGTIVTKIIETNVEAGTCVISINEDGVEIANGNISLKLNPDGTTNTAWIIYRTKELVLGSREDRERQASLDRITVGVNSE
jgi:hypothetical protein